MALRDHAGDHGLGYDEGGDQVHVDDLGELLGGHFAHRDAADDAGVVDQDVHHADLGLDLLHQRLHRGLVGHVADIAVGLDAGRFIGLHALVHQLLVDVVEYDGRAALGVGGGDGEADAIAGAGDPGDLALKAEILQKIVHGNLLCW